MVSFTGSVHNMPLCWWTHFIQSLAPIDTTNKLWKCSWPGKYYSKYCVHYPAGNMFTLNWPWHSVDLEVMWWEWMKQGQGVSYFIYITQALTSYWIHNWMKIASLWDHLYSKVDMMLIQKKVNNVLNCHSLVVSKTAKIRKGGMFFHTLSRNRVGLTCKIIRKQLFRGDKLIKIV